jgi:hypothetical protein
MRGCTALFVVVSWSPRYVVFVHYNHSHFLTNRLVCNKQVMQRAIRNDPSEEANSEVVDEAVDKAVDNAASA